jgi:hypothetical protein
LGALGNRSNKFLFIWIWNTCKGGWKYLHKNFEFLIKTLWKFVGFEVLTPVVINSTIFWNITPCSLLKVNGCFRGTYRLHLQGRRMIRSRNQRESRWQTENGFISQKILLFTLRITFSAVNIIQIWYFNILKLTWDPII